MEFGASSLVDSGSNLIGLAWTSEKDNPEEANQLITTTDSRVAVHSAEDQRLVLSWVTRPGSQTRFSLAAVQNRATRRFYCVQNGDRLVSWHENDTSLEKAVNVALRGEAFALRASQKVRLILVVYKDGGISAFNDGLAEILFIPGKADGTVVTWTRFARSPSNDAQFLLTTLRQPVAVAPGAAPAPATSSKGKKGGKASAATSTDGSTTDAVLQPYMTVYTINVAREKPRPQQQAYLQKQQQQQQQKGQQQGKGQQGKPASKGNASNSNSSSSASAAAPPAETYTFKQAAVHSFPPPPGAPAAGCLISSITLHKFLHAVTLVWTSGHMQVLQHAHTVDWYATTPRQTVLRKLGRFLPSAADDGEPSSSPASSQPFTCASFALEPSCIVIAGRAGNSDDSTSSSSADVGLTVWDARYGVVLGAKRLQGSNGSSTGEVADDDEEEGSAAAALAAVRASKRARTASAASSSSASAAPAADGGRDRANSSASVGSLLSAAQSLAGGSGGALTPDSVFQVTVNEDNSYVAVASRRRVIVTPVAARGASLLSALGKMDASKRMLAPLQEEGAGSAIVLPNGRSLSAVPTLNISDALRAATAAVKAAAPISPVDSLVINKELKAALQAAHANAAADVSAAASAVLDAAATPSASHVLQVLKSGKPLSSTAASSKPAKAGSKRQRQESAGGDEAEASAVLTSSLPSSLPPALVSAALYRCVAALRAQRAAVTGGDSAPAAGSDLDVASVLSPLLSCGVVSYSSCPELVPVLLAGLKVPKAARKAAAATASAESEKEASSKSGKKGTKGGKSAPAAASASSSLSSASSVAGAHAQLCLRLVCAVLGSVRDLPEGLLSRAFVDSLHSARACDLEQLWTSVKAAEKAANKQSTGAVSGPLVGAHSSNNSNGSSSSSSSSSPDLSPAVLGQLYVTGLIVASPRNDVFQEQALARALPVQDAVALLACLYRLLAAQATYAGISSGAAATSSSSASPAVLPLRLPTYGQVLDWVRMTLDAHFPRLLLLARAPGGEGSQPAQVRSLMTELVSLVGGEVGTSDALASLRGHVQHVMTRGPMPAPPPPDHTVEVVSL